MTPSGGPSPFSSLPERFVLAVGAIEPRKNIGALLDAWAMLDPALRRDFRLALAGPPGWHSRPVLRRIAALKRDVVFLGYLDVADLALCYNAASLFVYPSLYEGFGLPPLEAMACGTPVVASNRGALPETVEDHWRNYHADPNFKAWVSDPRYRVTIAPGDEDRKLIR